MKKLIAIVSIMMLVLSVNAQTTTAGFIEAAPIVSPTPAPAVATPTTPADFFSGIPGWMSTVNTNQSWLTSPFSIWTAANYQAGLNTSAEIGGSYDLWIPKPNLAVSFDGAFRNAGIAGTIVSGQGGFGLSILHYDLKPTLSLDSGYNASLGSGYVEPAFTLSKKMTASTYVALSLNYDFFFQGKYTQKQPGVSVRVGWCF